MPDSSPRTESGILRDESVCDRCGHRNPVWVAPSPLWNEVVRGGDISGSEEFDFVCPCCFIALAELRGIATEWRLYAKDVAVELQTVTPSGRVWNEETWMFEEPS